MCDYLIISNITFFLCFFFSMNVNHVQLNSVHHITLKDCIRSGSNKDNFTPEPSHSVWITIVPVTEGLLCLYRYYFTYYMYIALLDCLYWRINPHEALNWCGWSRWSQLSSLYCTYRFRLVYRFPTLGSGTFGEPGDKSEGLWEGQPSKRE